MSNFIDNFALISDTVIDNGDLNEINKIILDYEEKIENISISKERSYGYYILGNLYSKSRTIEQNKNIGSIWKLEKENVFKEIYYFRKAIHQDGFKELDLLIQLATYVNLGNAFSHYGRTINAIKYFDKAIALKFWHQNVVNHPNYFMALINKGLELEYYSQLDYDDDHKEFFIKFAYKNFKDAIPTIDNYLKNNTFDKEYYQNLKENIISKLQWYEEQFSFNNLEDIDYFLNYKTDFKKDENEYRKWCLNNKLFLNPLNDLGNYDISTHDPLNLPNIKTKIKEGFPKIITNFNQLKQEYISYRNLLFEGINEKTPKYYDKKTSITYDYEYNLYNINIEKIKMAFRGFYSIFDKIANFINEYFNLNMYRNNIYFSNIWYEYKNRQKIGLKDIFNKTENLALRGLFLISKDLFDDKQKEFFEVLEPESQKINDIRNHLEHKFISIKSIDSKIFDDEERERNFSISQDELEEKTIHLSQLAREAMIYLSFTIRIEESKKEVLDNTCISMELEKLTTGGETSQ